MLAYLFMAYGPIQEHDLVQNETRLMEVWDVSCPYKTVITQIDECVTYMANAGEPYLPGQMLSKTFHIVFRQGCSWRRVVSGNIKQQLPRPTCFSSSTSYWHSKKIRTKSARPSKPSMDWWHRNWQRRLKISQIMLLLIRSHKHQHWQQHRKKTGV
jgi:6-phosphogluconate dehydrogenase